VNLKDRSLIQKWLKESSVTCELPDTAIDKLTESAKIEQYRVVTLLTPSGENLQHLRLVIKGQIHLIKNSSDGKESTLIEMGPGEWVTWLGCFMRQPPVQDFYSAKNCHCIAIPVNDVIQIADHYPQLYRSIIDAIGTRFRLLLQWSEQNSLLTGDKRIAQSLLMRARFVSATQNTISLPITQERLSQLSGITRQTANGFLKDLQELGLITLGYKKINIPDVAKLSHYIDS
jgi:CRP-like cAMP-binding protein